MNTVDLADMNGTRGESGGALLAVFWFLVMVGSAAVMVYLLVQFVKFAWNH